MDDLLEGVLGVVFVLTFAFGLAALAYLAVDNSCRQPGDWVTYDNQSHVHDRIILYAAYGVGAGKLLLFFGLWCAVEGALGLLLVDEGEAGRSPGALAAYVVLFALFSLSALVGAGIWRYYANAHWVVLETQRRHLQLRDTARKSKTMEPLIDSCTTISFLQVKGVEAATEEVAVGGALEAFVLRGCCAVRRDPTTGLAMARVHCVRIRLADENTVHVLHLGGCARPRRWQGPQAACPLTPCARRCSLAQAHRTANQRQGSSHRRALRIPHPHAVHCGTRTVVEGRKERGAEIWHCFDAYWRPRSLLAAGTGLANAYKTRPRGVDQPSAVQVALQAR